MTTELPPLPDWGKARLRQLIAYLRVLPPEQFDFGVVIEERACGTVGCAMGHCAILFPELVERDTSCKTWDVQMRGVNNPGQDYGTVGRDLFGMGLDTAEQVFTPEWQRLVHDDLPMVYHDATPSQVADMLERYIELTETEVRA